MSEPGAFDRLRRAHEEEYFRQNEFAILARLRERAALGAAAGTTDVVVLDALRELGYTQESLRLLPLVPVIQTAWSDAEVAARERAAILELAEMRGIEQGSPAHSMLEQMLDVRPSHEFFERSLAVISILFDALPPERRLSSAQEIVSYCERVAAAAGGWLDLVGLGGAISRSEHELIERIAAVLLPESKT